MIHRASKLPPSPPQVWAVEDRSCQITWGDLPAGNVEARTEHNETQHPHEGGAGSLVLEGLQPGSTNPIELSWAGGKASLIATTMPAPTGELLTKFATISDLHLGSQRWGALKTMSEQAIADGSAIYDEKHPFRCAHGAITEAIAWGAELLVIKGDTVHHEVPVMFDQLGRLVDSFPDLPMLLVPGNHDVDKMGAEIPATVGTRALPFTRTVDHYDLNGIRVVAADTTRPGRGVGTLERVTTPTLDIIQEQQGPSFIGIHQQLQPHRLPRSWPAGIAAPESTDFLDQLDRLRQPVAVSSGHTHRNHSRLHGNVLVTQVASTKDWPGVWAGYTVHEGGISQTVRRIAESSAITWTEYSRGALLGLWGRWSPGSIDDRCVAHQWKQTVSATNY